MGKGSARNLETNIARYASWITSAYQNAGVNWHADTREQALDLTRQEDALHSIVLAILYAFTVSPRVAEDSLRYLRNAGVLKFEELAQKGCQLSWTNQDNDAVVDLAPELVKALNESYRRIPRLMTVAILRALAKLSVDFQLDPRLVFSRLNYDPVEVIRTLSAWKARLTIKSFWLAREMRIQNVWVDRSGVRISGEVCCVVDIQVRRALEHLGVNLRGASLLEISRGIWASYGELYDFPLLWFGRSHCSKVPRTFDCPLREQCPSYNQRPLL